MEKLAQPKEFCPNPACPDYGKRQAEPSKPNLKAGSKASRKTPFCVGYAKRRVMPSR